MDATRRRTLTRRALLALALWAGFWALSLGLAVALLWVPLAQARFQGGPSWTGLLAGLGGAVVLWALRPRLGAGAGGAPRPLEREAFPALHAFLDELARRSGAPPPDEVHLIEQPTAFISTPRPGLLRRRRQVIGLGLPLFAQLTREELGTVLAHEFGHRRGGDLLLGPWVHRTRVSLARAIHALDGSAFFLDAPFRAYGALFLGVSGAVSREQELAADAHAAAVHGVGPTARALRRVHRLGPPWAVYFAYDAAPLIETGSRVPLLEGFRRFLGQPRHRPEVREALQAALQERPRPGDTHPSLRERLEALGAGEAVPAGPPGSCLDLLGGEAAAEDAWYQRAVSGQLTARTWEAVGPEAVLPALRARHGQAAGQGEPDLSRLPALVARSDEVWAQVRPPGPSVLSPRSARQEGQRVLAGWLAATLSERGFELELRPGAALLLRRGELEVVPEEVVAGLASGELSAVGYAQEAARWSDSAAPRNEAGLSEP